MIIFYIVLSYVVSWFLVWVGVKMDNTKDLSTHSDEPGKVWDSETFNYISYDIRRGHYWFLIFPISNLIAATIYFFRGLCTYIYYNWNKEQVGKVTDYIFGSKFNKDDKNRY